MTRRAQNRKGERQDRIIALLRANPTVRIAELARAFDVSTETVRRDLDELGNEGALNRTYGGAARSAVGYEAAIDQRLLERVAERNRIALCATRLVEPGHLLMIDGGSTTILLARQLAAEGRDLTVLTNCPGVAAALGRNNSIKIALCPGDYQAHEGIVTGPETVAFLERFVVDTAFIGASGLTEQGPSEVHPGATWVKRRMLAQAERGCLLLDGSKFGIRRHELICRLPELADLVTDQDPAPPLAKALAAASVKVHLAAGE